MSVRVDGGRLPLVRPVVSPRRACTYQMVHSPVSWIVRVCSAFTSRFTICAIGRMVEIVSVGWYVAWIHVVLPQEPLEILHPGD